MFPKFIKGILFQGLDSWNWVKTVSTFEDKFEKEARQKISEYWFKMKKIQAF